MFNDSKTAHLSVMRSALLLAATMAAAAAAGAATLRVPQNYSTIQSAIDAARAGDTVLVSPGTYVEVIDFVGQNITVQSTAGAETTVIDGNQVDSVVRFHSGETRAAVLRGFTVRNGRANAFPLSGGGIQIYEASPTIEGNVVTASTACNGNGISAEFSNALIVRNHVHHNVTTFCTGGTVGGGVLIGGNGAVELTGNLIEFNRTDLQGGGVGLNAAGNPVITRNVIRRNAAGDTGGGFGMFNDSQPFFADNLVYGNSASFGGGVYLFPPAGSTGGVYVNNTIADNTANLGSEIYTDGFADAVQIQNNILRTSVGQSALHCDDSYDSKPPIVRANLIHGAAAGGICARVVGRRGNVDGDPAFVGGNKAQPKSYGLTAGSAAIDAGSNAYAADIEVDLQGNPRIADGNHDGVSRVDLGAFEFRATH